MENRIFEKLEIRPLEVGDALQVASLIKQLSKNIVEPEKLQQRIKQMAFDMAIVKNHFWLVGTIDRKVVAFCGVVFYTIPSKGLVAQVEEVIVDMKFRGKGIGTKILSKLMKSLKDRKVGQMRLTASNPIAQHIYEKYGFVVKEGEQFFSKKCK